MLLTATDWPTRDPSRGYSDFEKKKKVCVCVCVWGGQITDWGWGKKNHTQKSRNKYEFSLRILKIVL